MGDAESIEGSVSEGATSGSAVVSMPKRDVSNTGLVADFDVLRSFSAYISSGDRKFVESKVNFVVTGLNGGKTGDA